MQKFHSKAVFFLWLPCYIMWKYSRCSEIQLFIHISPVWSPRPVELCIHFINVLFQESSDIEYYLRILPVESLRTETWFVKWIKVYDVPHMSKNLSGNIMISVRSKSEDFLLIWTLSGCTASVYNDRATGESARWNRTRSETQTVQLKLL